MPQHGHVTRLRSVLDTDDLPLAELCAARIDGEVMRLGEAWCPVDEPDLPSLRAAAVATNVPATAILERRSAAWVHGALPSPPVVSECCVPHSERVSVRALRQSVHLREVAIEPDEVVIVGPIRCTTVERTIHDLVRDPISGSDAIAIVAALIELDPAAGHRARSRIEGAHRMPHKGAALERLDAAAGLSRR
ncbi:hypothetical protein DSM26151_16450 [Agromyces marinus]|nr:hypothetical protein DSM26151_16450 [Agromyces marinus]BDZ56299.1 hypothetical protein GCM10025870_33720 [Agromyces marinus]